jgi:hypothetical protein
VETTKLAASGRRSSSGSSFSSLRLLGSVTSSTKRASTRPEAALTVADTTLSTSTSEMKAPWTRDGLAAETGL